MTTPICADCGGSVHLCSGCFAPLSHADCEGRRFGCCDDCQPLLEARS